MQKTLIFIIGAIGVGGVILLIILAVLTRNAAQTPGTTTGGQTNTNTNTYTGSITTTPAGSQGGTQEPTMTIETPGGATIQARDITKDPELVKDASNPGIYYLGHHYRIEGATSTAGGSTNPPYVIEYIAASHYFNITLLTEPLAQTRLDAEQYLMSRLGISQANMCQLDYMVSTPNFVSQLYAGQDLRFSFCPGATRL